MTEPTLPNPDKQTESQTTPPTGTPDPTQQTSQTQETPTLTDKEKQELAELRKLKAQREKERQESLTKEQKELEALREELKLSKAQKLLDAKLYKEEEIKELSKDQVEIALDLYNRMQKETGKGGVSREQQQQGKSTQPQGYNPLAEEGKRGYD
jgi:hypothetical protein